MGKVRKNREFNVQDSQSLIEFLNVLVNDFYPNEGDSLNEKQFSTLAYWSQNMASALTNRNEQEELTELRRETKKLMKLVNGKNRNLKVV